MMMIIINNNLSIWDYQNFWRRVTESSRWAPIYIN